MKYSNILLTSLGEYQRIRAEPQNLKEGDLLYLNEGKPWDFETIIYTAQHFRRKVGKLDSHKMIGKIELNERIIDFLIKKDILKNSGPHNLNA